MEIYILDGATLNRLGIVDEYESFIWNTSYNGIGTFELKCGIGFFGLLQADRLIQCTEDLKHNGVIEHILKVTNDDGSESIQVKGRMAEILLDRRLCLGKYAYESQQPAVIASSLITKNAIENRPIEHLEIGTLIDADEGVIDYAGANKSLCEEVQAVCQASLLGFNLRADTDEKKLVFDTYKGLNRTEEDNTVTHIEENIAENLLANGFFSNGFDGWTQHHNNRGYNSKTEEYRTGYPLVNSGGIVSKSRVYDWWEIEDNKWGEWWNASPYLTQTVNLNSEHLYYMAAKCKNPLNAVLSFGIKDGDTIYLNFEKGGDWVEKGCLYVPSESGKYTFYAGYGELPEKEGDWASWDYCILLDLTATFGVGKEPSLDFCKNNVYFSNDQLMYKTQIIEFVENHTPPLVFSRDRDTLLSVEYEKSIVNECTYLYVQGEGDISTVLTLGNAEGLKLKEKYLDLSNIPRTVDGVELPEASYIAMLQNAAKATMRQLVVNEIIDGTLYKLSNKQFGKDFYLGDIACFVDKRMNYAVNLRISAVQQIWDSNGYNVTVTLGDDVPNIIETIKLVGKGAK